jgi:hypothetical protein
MVFESLEPRLLLSAAPFHTAALDQAGMDLTFRLENESGPVTHQRIDNALDTAKTEAVKRDAFAGQVIYLDVDGARNVTYDGPIRVSGIDVPAFKAPDSLAGQEHEIIASVLADLDRIFAGTGIVFTVEQPQTEGTYSKIYIGGDGSAFAAYGPLLGLSEKVDPGNRDPNDIAFIFSDTIGEFPSLLGMRLAHLHETVADYGRDLAGYIAHEVGHLLGFEHAHTVHTDDAGDVLAEVAFKPYTHVEIAKDVRADLLEDGKLNIAGHEYEVHPKLLKAIEQYPSYYYAGAVGPDGFPDLVFGQSIIHPIDTGVWLQRLFDMAWAAQKDPSFTADERPQILAFTYGYATHAAGDLFAHTLVNEFSEGIFPSVPDIAQDDRDLANAVRHLMVEGYIGDATPGFDNVSDHTLLPDGDISDDSSQGITFNAPMHFIYKALIKPFPGEPVAIADTGKGF